MDRYFENICKNRLILIGVQYIGFQILFFNLMNVQIRLNPLFLIFSYLQNLVNIRFWTCVLTFCISSSVAILAEYKLYTKNAKNFDSRFTHILYFLSPNNLKYFLIIILHSILTVLAFTLTDYYLSLKDTNLIYLLLVGIWTVTVLYLTNYVSMSDYKLFQPIVMCKTPINAFSILRLLPESFYKSFKMYTIIFISYFIILRSLYFVLTTSVYSIFSPPFISPNLLICGWILCIFLIFSNKLRILLFDNCLVDHITFPIQSNNNSQYDISLISAMASYEMPLLQYLGYYDLFLLSGDENRTKEVFLMNITVSNASAWLDLSQECISFIEKVRDMFQKVVSSQQKFDRFYMPRSGIHSYQYEPPQVEENRLSNTIKSYFQFRFINYFFEPLPENEICTIMRNYSQSMSLACLSLANLTSASLKQDSYGIVLNSLPVIINSLLKLRLELNRLDALINQRRIPRIVKLLYKSLTWYVKCSLYKLALTYGPFLKDLSLSAEQEEQFRSFILFKEI